MSHIPTQIKNRFPAASAISPNLPAKHRFQKNRNGFVCLYFLILFLLVTMILTAAISSSMERSRTAANTIRANELLGAEAAVLSYVKCGLRNESLEDGSYEENGVSFSLSLHGGRIDAVIDEPYSEVLQITLYDDRYVYDYDVVRSEEPAQ